MSLKEFVKNHIKKLCDSFNEKAKLEAKVLEEMRNDGWTFEYFVAPSYYAAMCMPVLTIKTPEGRPVYGVEADPADEIRYQKAVEQKRKALSPQP